MTFKGYKLWLVRNRRNGLNLDLVAREGSFFHLPDREEQPAVSNGATECINSAVSKAHIFPKVKTNPSELGAPREEKA